LEDFFESVVNPLEKPHFFETATAQIIDWRGFEGNDCYKRLKINKKGLHFCKPLISLVAGRGFEPLTFGL